MKEYARRTRGDAVLITSHFYGMGPASDPAMTADRLLQKSSPALEEFLAGARAASTAAGGTPFRMDEGNSCFGGGRPGVSDTYASALWVADFMLRAASAGLAGVNLHGGGSGFYTPIESSDKSPVVPRPMYFGMQFAQQFAGFSVVRCALKTSANVTAHVATKGTQSKIAVVNKGAQPVDLQLPASFQGEKITNRWTLRGPSLSAKEGVRFGGEPLHSAANAIPGYSGVILQTG